MKKGFPVYWLLALLPLLLILLPVVWLDHQYEQYPILHFQVDLVSFLFLLGLLFSLLVVLFFLFRNKQQKDRESFLEEAARERRLFLQRLDHELKNPLNTIQTGLAYLSALYTDLLAGKGPDLPIDVEDSENPQTVITKIKRQVGRMTDLIFDLRKLSDLEVRPLALKPVDMNRLLENLFADLQENPASARRKLSLSLPQDPWLLPEIQADEDLIQLSIRNLLENAVKYTEPDDTVSLRGYENNQHVIIEVSDSGLGIPQEELEHIWDDLYRAKNSRGIPGSGLGLSMVRTIIHRHKGEVSVRSQNGRGTEFTLQLPK